MNYYAYIAISGENKILRFRMDAGTGMLDHQEEINLSGSPGPLAVDPKQRYLYAGIHPTNEIMCFSIDHSTGGLSPLGTVSLDSAPCYLATDRSGRFLLSAYYQAGIVTVHPIGDGGVVGSQAIQSIPTAEHAHCIQTDRSNRFAFVPHTVPPNAIYQFHFDAATGHLTPNAAAKVVAEEGEGPRHFVLHPSKDITYTSNENGSSVTAYHFDPSAGNLSADQTLSTLPEDYGGENTCAQIHIHPTGKFLYVSNRGHDSIACFAVHDDTGQLTSLGQQSTESIPRVFNLDPEGKFLFAAGQESGQLAAYRIHPQTGALQPLERYTVGQQPMWVMILGLG